MWKVLLLSCVLLVGCGDEPERSWQKPKVKTKKGLKSLEVRVQSLERCYQLDRFPKDVVRAARKSVGSRTEGYGFTYSTEEERKARIAAMEHGQLIKECQTISRLIRAGAVEVKKQ